MHGHGRVVIILSLLATLAGGLSRAEAGLRVRSGEMATRAGATRIAAGEAHTCMVQEDGAVRCWGAGSGGRLGHGSHASSLTPVTVSTLTQAVGVAAGAQSTCALSADGATWCWGDKQGGSLGNGTFNSSSVPVKVIGLTHAVALDADWAHSCAVRADGKPFCWGLNFAATLGDGTTEHRNTAVAVSSLTDAVTIGTGGVHSCALRANGTVACWGWNDRGQLGDGTHTTALTPVAVSGVTDAVDLMVADGGYHNCALRAGGTAVCWGDNHQGQLGDGAGATGRTPVAVSGLTSAVALAGGASATGGSAATGAAHTCALRADGTVWCWGGNGSGQLGDGTTTNRTTPVAVSGLTDAVAIAAGWNHTCALRADGSAVCWGKNSSGQLGDGTTANSSTPRTVVDVQGSISATGVWGGELHSCAIRGDGRVTCWGSNEYGQLGDGTTMPRLTPAKTTSGPAVALALGASHTCALAANGTASCWGRNDSGQLGNGVTSTRPTPPQPVSGLTDAVALAAGTSHTCALRANGTVVCWGDNHSGQLGNGASNNTTVPVGVIKVDTFVGPLNGIVAIAAGAAHSCAVRFDGTALCWGQNASGQLGDRTTQSRSIPAAVDVLTGAVALTAGDAHTCALTANGAVSCWGSNLEGGLGNGTTVDATTPVDVVSLVRTVLGTLQVPISKAVGVAAGRRHACALIADGTARCWGHNGGGELGDGTTENRLTAVAVRGMSDAAGMTAGANYTCHVQADGQPFCWGHNETGQIGDGTTEFQSLPVAVPSFLFNVDQVADLRADGDVVDVQVLVNCPEGGRLHARVTLTQAEATGRGVGSGRCTGGLASYAVTVSAQGRTRFQSGPADASLDAVVQERGRVADQQHWEEVIELID